jgi:putative ABC transport system ATP-binding protein
LENVAVKTSTVCKGFGSGETRTEVLKEVNFEARVGELLLLVGPSGCGKTTLLSVIAGTLTVDRGEVDSGRERGVHAALHVRESLKWLKAALLYAQ